MDEIKNIQSAPAGAADKDPVCGMTVDPARAKATHERAGKMYYFCCVSCKEKFSAAPEKYLTPKALVGIAPGSAPPMQIAPASTQPHGGPIATAKSSPVAPKVASCDYT